MLSEDTLYLSVRELGERIRGGKLSPVELAESFLARSEDAGPEAECLRDDHARAGVAAGARGGERNCFRHYRGPLHGVPYAAKDLVAVQGYPTTWGARPLAKQSFDYNATVIEKLNRAGAVLIGKAAMIELAGGLGYSAGDASLTGPCKNPWNTKYWTCGSSSGSGAIVACGDGALGDRVGYARVDYLSFIMVRNFGDAAEFWAREPARRDGDCVDDG